MRRTLWWMAAAAAALLLVTASAVVLLALRMRPAAGDWSHTVHVGPVALDVGVRRSAEVATHPLVLRATAGRPWSTPAGPVQWQRTPDGAHWVLRCAPCSVRRTEWGNHQVLVPEVRVLWPTDRDGVPARGTVVLADGDRQVSGEWALAFDGRAAHLDFSFTDVALADAFHLLAAIVPEARRAHIEGRLDLAGRWTLPDDVLTWIPAVSGFRVSGLGTEALRHVDTHACGVDGSFGAWLPRAVIAAEDQRFHLHAGFDAGAIAAHWSRNGRAGRVAGGASTLSQQVARLVYTGAARGPGRKLSELLYAVELDRTLGKARVLHLYLSIAPWGAGRCGAASAARHHFGRPPASLDPLEAAWLASLLHDPDGETAEWTEQGHVHVARVDWVLDQMRPLPPRRHRRLPADWQPVARSGS